MSVRIRDYLGHVPLVGVHPVSVQRPRRTPCAPSALPRPPAADGGHVAQKGASLQPLTSEFSGYFRARRAPNDLRVRETRHPAWGRGEGDERRERGATWSGLGNRAAPRENRGKIVFAPACRYVLQPPPIATPSGCDRFRGYLVSLSGPVIYGQAKNSVRLTHSRRNRGSGKERVFLYRVAALDRSKRGITFDAGCCKKRCRYVLQQVTVSC